MREHRISRLFIILAMVVLAIGLMQSCDGEFARATIRYDAVEEDGTPSTVHAEQDLEDYEHPDIEWMAEPKYQKRLTNETMLTPLEVREMERESERIQMQLDEKDDANEENGPRTMQH